MRATLLVLAFLLVGLPLGALPVSGRVIDAAGRPVAGVRITLNGPGGTVRTSVTDTEGGWSVAVEPGSWSVTASASAGRILPSRLETRVDTASREDRSFLLVTAADPTIDQVQGESHRSLLAGLEVTGVAGIVTAVRGRLGYYLQSPLPDGNPSTSEGLLVTDTVERGFRPGDLVVVDGKVVELFQSGSGSGALTMTTIRARAARKIAGTQPLPDPVILGEGGRVPPDRIVSDDAQGDVESSPYDPEHDGIDFYESLEGMLVTVLEPQVVGPTYAATGETEIVGDRGRHASGLTARGGLIATTSDLNPERITVDLRADPDILGQPALMLTVGDRLDAPVTGILDHASTGYRILPTLRLEPPGVPALPRQAAPAFPAGSLTVACLNLENYSPQDPGAKTRDLAATVVDGLGNPDILALQEVQDSSGPTDDGVVSADGTLEILTRAIAAHPGGVSYAWVEVPPENNQDGGQPGGNIRSALLYNPERVRLVLRTGESPTRLAPESTVFRASRKPLVVELDYQGQPIVVIVLHLTSRSGDGEVFGRVQPQVSRSAEQRARQTRLVADFVRAVTGRRPDTEVIVLGDLNDDGSSPALVALREAGLTDLAELLLPPAERYTYVYRGNSQELDHILVSRGLTADAAFWIRHRYAEYPSAGRWTDHDPIVAALKVRNGR